jgi:hypothetical protein
LTIEPVKESALPHFTDTCQFGAGCRPDYGE